VEKMLNAISVAVGVVGGMLTYLYGGFDTLLITLLIFIALDYITGIIKGIYTKSLSSEISFKGLLKKIMILIVVSVSNVLQHLLNGAVPLREIVIMFYVANEGISLLENAAVLLPNMPDKLKEVLLQLRVDCEISDNNKNDS